jgi:uncharacterized protein involved in outer membrane biogenesis
VQTTLLGLAIAIILALVSAIVAPLVVDWNHYRAPIEAEASRLTGLIVQVNGSIDARLVPTPMITLRDVDIGAAGQPPLLRAGMLKLELSLGPLFRGEVQATEADLVAPDISLGLDPSGAIALPALTTAFRPETLSISHFSVSDGHVTLTDAASGGQIVLKKFWFDGDIASLAGPFNGQGAAVVGGQLYGYRISGSAFEQGGMRVRLGVDPSDFPLTTQFEGRLSFANGAPQFDGTLDLARPVGAALANGVRVLSEPWHATGTLKATPAAASLRNVTFRYGPEERALNFTTEADVTFGAQPHLTGKIAATQIDVDRALADPEATDRPPLQVLKSFLQSFVATAKLPVPGEIGLSVDALTIGGTSIESLQGNLNFDRDGWSLDQFQFHAPGMTAVTLSGRLTGTAQGFAFSGPATLGSADLEMLLKWLGGSSRNGASDEAKTFNARGNVTVASDRIAVEQLDATLGQEKIDGRLAYNWPEGNRPARLDAELRAGELDLDALSAFARSAGGNGFALPQEAVLALDIDKATFAGVDARAVNAQVKFDTGKLEIDRLSVGDLGGAKLAVSGRLDDLSSQPRGQITLDLAAGALDGMSDIAAKFMPQSVDFLHRVAARLAPANVHAVLDVEQVAAGVSTAELQVNGNLAAMRLAVDGKASGERAHLGAAAVQIDGSVNADDGTALVALLGLDRVLAVDQLPGQLILSASGTMSGDIHLNGKVAMSGLASAIAGTLRLTGDRAPSAKLQVEAAAGDLRPLHQAMTGQPGAAVPVTAHAALAVDGGKFSFTGITATIGKNALHGNIAVDWTEPIGINGDIEADEVDAASAVALLLGLPTNAQSNDAQWSSEPLGAGAFAATNGAVGFKFDHAAFTPGLVARDLKGVAHFSSAAISLDHIDGGFAGGHLGGSLTFQRNAAVLAAHAKLDLANAAAATLLGPALNATNGQVSLALSSDGFGASPAALISSLQGTGTAKLKDVQFAGLDASVFAAARQAAGQTGPIDLNKVQAAVNAALANGRLAVAQDEQAITLTSGAINLDHVALPTNGAAQLALNGAIDFGSAAIDLRMTLSQAPPASALIPMRPELSIAIKGPIASPQRTLDIAALTSWLTLSAAELQTRRIESIEAGAREAISVPDVHPAAPDAHSLSPGTAIESSVPANLAAPPAGTRGIERLQPKLETKPAAPSPVPEQSGSISPVPAPAIIRPSNPRAPNNAAAVGAE